MARSIVGEPHIAREPCVALDAGGSPPRTRQRSSMPTTVDDIRAYVREHDVEVLFAQFVDMHGKPSAKLVPASHLDDLLTDGAGFAGYAAGSVGQQPNDPDLIAMPDPASFTPL